MEYKIMLIEDDVSIAKLLSSHIEKYGYKTIMVSDFDKILDIFIETNPHLVLLDINLPNRCYGAFAPVASGERKIEFEGLTLYPERHELHFNNNSTLLTKKETVLAEILIRMSPRAVSRDVLMEKLWDDQAFIDENTLNVNVARLRKKLQEIGIDDALETVRGYGYRLNVTWGKM